MYGSSQETARARVATVHSRGLNWPRFPPGCCSAIGRMAWSADDEGPLENVISQAELTLQHLLHKQLSTSGRLERVDFKQATETLLCVGHSSSGIASHAQFCKSELNRKQQNSEAHALHGQGLTDAQIKDHFQKISTSVPDHEKGLKRKRYGLHPDFARTVQSVENGLACRVHEKADDCHEAELDELSSRHEREIESSVQLGKDVVRQIAHLSAKDIHPRRSLLSHAEDDDLHHNLTPQERARHAAEEKLYRPVTQVFRSPAPPVLDLHSYLQQMKEEAVSTQACTGETSCSGGEDGNGNRDWKIPEMSGLSSEHEATAKMEVEEVPLSCILQNRLQEAEIKQLAGGKFSNYAPGQPSDTLYIKNLSPQVTEQDLVALFIRYQRPGQHLTFRLMQRGRMKGQAFITFPDRQTSKDALELVNGYKLKERPMVIQFGRQSSKSLAS